MVHLHYSEYPQWRAQPLMETVRGVSLLTAADLTDTLSLS